MNAINPREERLTIYDLAQEAGVSTATVSRALKNDPLIKLTTRIRIKELADKLNYRPSSIASSLAKGRTGRIGLLLPHIQNPFYSTLNATILEQARLHNYEIVTGYFDKNTDPLLNSFLNMHLDGIIMEIREWTENAEKIANIAGKPGARPIVLRRKVADDYPLDAIYPDFTGATRIATEYLIGLGHRKIAYLGTADEERGKSFTKTAKEHASKEVSASCVRSDPNPQAAYHAALSILSEKDHPTALLVMNDFSAQGVLRATGELKIRIPDELSVVGFDDVELSSFGYIPLTTMHHPIDKLGARLLELMLARISGDKSPPKHEAMSFKLVERASSGPLKG
ncbi:MAG TPA: hypothetical protein DCZ94_22235 [Lentisphaeria bacterium]|nr:MAG: hypothetical protein A2X48_13475 [Lentisphaerae bacterium GWF2_49_21]HBC89667.1 hypothetical protein [Lentisphaeria bacterium]